VKQNLLEMLDGRQSDFKVQGAESTMSFTKNQVNLFNQDFYLKE